MVFATVAIILVGTLWSAYVINVYRGEPVDKYALFFGFAIITVGLILLLIS